MLMTQTLRGAHFRADALSGSLAPAQLRARINEARVRYESAYDGCHAAIERQVEDSKKRLAVAAASLDALSPLAVLQRGFSIAQKADGSLLRDASSVSVGDSVKLRLARGRIDARVEQVEEIE